MNLRRLLAVARKEFLHIRRDPRSLGMAIAIPMLLILLFGYALTLDVDNVPIAVWDQSVSPESRELISRFEGSRYFAVRLRAKGYPDIERAIEGSQVMAAVVIPRDFSTRLATGRVAAVQFLIDGSDSNTATIALGYAESVALGYSRDIAFREAKVGGTGTRRDPLEVLPRVWFNADMESKNYIIPGLIAVIMMVIAALLTSLTVAKEWETGTMEQLISSPILARELVLGKLLPYVSLGMLDVLLAVGMGEFLFQVPLRGSVALLFGMAAVFLAGALSMGMVISIVTKSQLLASQLAMVLTFLPSFLLSGFLYAIGNMPKPIRIVTYAIPSRYFVTLLKGIYLKGTGLSILLGEAALLTAFGAAMVLLANRKFRKKLA
ncbi:MAG TPA: ABC transporter permease [Candidatus Deferrimicrobiaceae bacterium]|nr:ABC transporter permease [Candidatus Deferrimicrobiaceae bacterium]